jgi:hypothetical protein
MGHRAGSGTLGRFPWQLFSFIVCGQNYPESKNRQMSGIDPDKTWFVSAAAMPVRLMQPAV